MPDFNDATKLGTASHGRALSNLIAIFENPALDFSKNRADGDDILGDAYEYLMRHFASESGGKSKGQFYTPAEVSRIMAKILGIGAAQTSNEPPAVRPHLRLRFPTAQGGEEASAEVTLYGQEKDATTSGLARMNMILHDNPTALIAQGNTLSDPNSATNATTRPSKPSTMWWPIPRFSDKRWSNGLIPQRPIRAL